MQLNPGKQHPAWSDSIVGLQGFGIALVVIGHATQPVSSPVIPEPLHVIISIIYAFHMPLFMAISGYLFAGRNKPEADWNRFVSGKANRLLVPYLFIGAVGTAACLSRHHFAGDVYSNGLSVLVHGALFPWANTVVYLWFLPTLFLVTVFLAPISRFLRAKRPLRGAICCGLLALSAYIGPDNTRYSVTYLNLSGVGYYLGYFWLGICLFESRHYIALAFTKKSAVASLILACGVAAIAPPRLSGVLILRAICGVVASFAIAMLWGKMHLNGLQTLSRYSYQIYLLSWFFQVGAMGVASRHFSLGPYSCAALSVTLGIAGPVTVAHLVEVSGLPCRVLFGLRSTAPAASCLPRNLPA